MAELVDKYLDLPLGIVDAAVVAIAERLKLTEVATVNGQVRVALAHFP
jgi:predicted nucleic acid-binding protein